MVYYYKYDASPRHVSRMLNEIGSHYDMMNRFDSASFYYRKSLMVLPDTNNLTYRDIATLLAFLSYKTGEVPKTSLNQLKRLLGQSETPKEALSRCAIVGEIFYQEKQYDSAWVYLNKVFRESQSIGLTKQSAERLVEICKALGKEEEIIDYAGFLVPFATQDEDKGKIKTQLTELYNTFRQNELSQQHHQEAKKRTKLALVVFGGLIVLVLAVVFFSRRKNQNLENQIKTEHHTHKMQQAALAGRLKQSNEALQELEGQMKQRDKSNAHEPQAASFAEEPVCQLIMERVSEGQFKSQMDCRVYKDFALSKAQLSALREAADRHFNHFTTRLSEAHPELTRNDLDYCCLYLLGLTDADIAALMQRAYNTVNERNSKLRRVFGSENPISATLQGFANGFSNN